MEIEIIKCSGPVLRPGKGGIDKIAMNAVADALRKQPMSFDQLLEETGLDMAVLADVLREMTREKSVAKGINASGVVFQLTD